MYNVDELYAEYGVEVPVIDDRIMNNCKVNYPYCTIKTKYGNLKFMTTSQSTLWRIKNLFFLEPETINWIKSFEKEKTVFDIGANMGVYSIWSALAKKMQVYSFEPEVENFRLLHLNVALNKLESQISYYPIAIADEFAMSKLFLSNIQPAVSGHSFGINLDGDLKQRNDGYTQGSISFTLDELVNRNCIPVPEYIKIDVDGLEYKIISGANETLQNEKVRSVLIEINTSLQEHLDLIDKMYSYGFVVDNAQVNKSRQHITNNFPGFENLANYIFFRE